MMMQQWKNKECVNEIKRFDLGPTSHIVLMTKSFFSILHFLHFEKLAMCLNFFLRFLHSVVLSCMEVEEKMCELTYILLSSRYNTRYRKIEQLKKNSCCIYYNF